MAVLSKSADWVEMRKAYVEREIKPTLEELTQEFGSSIQRISVVAIDEAWGVARAERIEKRLRDAEAGELIVARISGERTLVDAGKNACLSVLRQLGQLAENLDQKKGDSTRANTLNNISFAISNTCNALKTIGVLGTTKGLPKDGDGKIDFGFLQQINVNVQQIKDQAGIKVPDIPTTAINDLHNGVSSDANGVKAEHESTP